MSAVWFVVFIILIFAASWSGKAGLNYSFYNDFGESGVVYFAILGIIVNWLYFALMESSSKRGTIGKLALSLRVTDTSGNRISFGRATGRYWGKIISTIIFYIGFLMIAWNSRKQGLHDIMAETLVLRKGDIVPSPVA